MKQFTTPLRSAAVISALLLCAFTAAAGRMIDGVTGPTFNLTAKDGYISTPDGNSLYCWGYANGDGLMQYPGPTLIVNQGQTVTVNLSNTLSVPVSILFPGQVGITASGGTAGSITREAGPGGGTVSYTFVAGQPGTYLYNSGTRMDLQIEMGLVGALIVRPPVATQAYTHTNTAFTHEYLFLLTEMDPRVHDLVDLGLIDDVDTTTFFPTYWFINGRCSPDTMAEPNVSWLPHQPYNCMPTMHPGEKLLLRLIDAGRDPHPFHHHGNNSLTIARDGRMLESAPGLGPDLADSDFTVKMHPGGTADAIFEWTGANLGWDMYGHGTNDALKPYEYAPDHGKPLPVKLPHVQDVQLGEQWSGSPFLGQTGFLPPSPVNFNPGAAYLHMWHSHNEKEIVNNDIFPGGLMTMLVIEPWP
jgi:FtsP/CotA-like multicopper oxidase with cupredoxin domain